MTIISAPAGSGKTCLLRTWADRPGQPHQFAVMQVQRDQHDAQQFWLALLDAVRQASGTAGRAEPPAATPDFNAPAMVDRVLSELADAHGGVTLVIDDLHELNSPEALSQLTRLLMNLPPQVHAMLTTRHDVRLRLHQLRLAGELAEIRAADLRFTERETRMMLDASGIALPEAGTALLHQRTEGWAAGLRLAALSLAGHPDPERFVAEFSGSDRTVAEYLIAEMLERQPPDVQDLLLRTSLLDRVNGELADLLTGRPGSERILLELEDANAFVESLDPERTWFRYHHLFGDLLRLELRRALPGDVPGLHRRAADWLIQQGQVVEAIRHTQAAGDWPEAARLLADHSFSLTLDGQAQTIQALVRAFPLGTDHPELALVPPDPGDAGSPAGPQAWRHGPRTRPVRDPDQRPPRRHDTVRVSGAGVEVARRAHRAHRAPGPVRAVRRAGRDRGARPGPARGPPAHAGPQITRIRRQPLTVTATTVGRTRSLLAEGEALMTSAPVRDPLADHLITTQNAALLLIDYQPAQLAAVHAMDHALLLLGGHRIRSGRPRHRPQEAHHLRPVDEICMAFTALDALREGYEVYPVVDAIGGTSPEAHRAGLDRVMQAGGQPISWVSLAGQFSDCSAPFDASELRFYVEDMPVTLSSRRVWLKFLVTSIGP